MGTSLIIAPFLLAFSRVSMLMLMPFSERDEFSNPRLRGDKFTSPYLSSSSKNFLNLFLSTPHSRMLIGNYLLPIRYGRSYLLTQDANDFNVRFFPNYLTLPPLEKLFLRTEYRLLFYPDLFL